MAQTHRQKTNPNTSPHDRTNAIWIQTRPFHPRRNPQDRTIYPRRNKRGANTPNGSTKSLGYHKQDTTMDNPIQERTTPRNHIAHLDTETQFSGRNTKEHTEKRAKTMLGSSKAQQ